MKPFVKWAGGKRQILSHIKTYIESSLEDGRETFTYIEPFLGGGAVFLDLKPQRAIINDLNSDLMNAYEIIRSEQYLELIEMLRDFSSRYREDADEFYYEIRHWDRDEDWGERTPVEKAARMIFLNKTCYNGLYRVNNRGEFNTPIGRYVNPLICDEQNIRELHQYFIENQIEMFNESYEVAIRMAQDGDIIYVDPPYDYEDNDGFTKYQMAGFTFDNFIELKEECDRAIDRGAFVILSNNATTNVLELFSRDSRYRLIYDQKLLNTMRNINSNGSERRTGHEVIIWGIPGGFPFPQANDMKKIIKLIMLEDETLNNKELAMSVIEVKTERQVAYYLSALMYLGYINKNKEFTTKAKKVKNNEMLLKKDIFNTLLKNKVFGSAYKDKKNNSYSLEKTIKYLKKENPSISIATATRRSSTVLKWVEWMLENED